MESQQYQQQLSGEHMGTRGSGVQAEIFYKRENDKVVYEEGQETYRGFNEEKYEAQQKKEQAAAPHQEHGDVFADNGASLRRRGISPQTQQAINQQKHNFQQNQREIARGSDGMYEQVNETGFTYKMN